MISPQGPEQSRKEENGEMIERIERAKASPESLQHVKLKVPIPYLDASAHPIPPTREATPSLQEEREKAWYKERSEHHLSANEDIEARGWFMAAWDACASLYESERRRAGERIAMAEESEALWRMKLDTAEDCFLQKAGDFEEQEEQLRAELKAEKAVTARLLLRLRVIQNMIPDSFAFCRIREAVDEALSPESGEATKEGE